MHRSRITLFLLLLAGTILAAVGLSVPAAITFAATTTDFCAVDGTTGREASQMSLSFLVSGTTYLPLVQRTGDDLSGQLCPTWVHDRYKVQAADGNWYPTWHPTTEPNYGCYFDHEHGDDPRTSLANTELPPFGYINAAANEDHDNHEPHNGFKVFVVNAGDTNNEGRTATTSTRIVAHMGTGGVARFDRQFHSFMFDLVAPDGHEVHTQGMADTGQVGSVCERDISLGDSDPTNDIGRAVVTLPDTGCDVSSLYEIWLFVFDVGDRVRVHGSTAVFDPITVMDSSDHTRLLPTADYFDEGYGREYHGCKREAYHGPVYWYNQTGAEVYHTDAYGVIAPNGPLEQRVSRHNDIGIPMNQNQSQMKYISDSCVSGLGETS